MRQDDDGRIVKGDDPVNPDDDGEDFEENDVDGGEEDDNFTASFSKVIREVC